MKGPNFVLWKHQTYVVGGWDLPVGPVISENRDFLHPMSVGAPLSWDVEDIPGIHLVAHEGFPQGRRGR